jgi:hypothetical protein
VKRNFLIYSQTGCKCDLFVKQNKKVRGRILNIFRCGLRWVCRHSFNVMHCWYFIFYYFSRDFAVKLNIFTIMRSYLSSRDLLLCLHLRILFNDVHFLWEIFDFLMLIQQNNVISSLWLKISQIEDNPYIFWGLSLVKFSKAEVLW